MNEPSASISAAALHLLLATHPELDDLPVAWNIDSDRVIRPFIVVYHPDGERAVKLIAAALELDTAESPFANHDGERSKSVQFDGRWGGAAFQMVTYVLDQIEVGR